MRMGRARGARDFQLTGRAHAKKARRDPHELQTSVCSVIVSGRPVALRCPQAAHRTVACRTRGGGFVVLSGRAGICVFDFSGVGEA